MYSVTGEIIAHPGLWAKSVVMAIIYGVLSCISDKTWSNYLIWLLFLSFTSVINFSVKQDLFKPTYTAECRVVESRNCEGNQFSERNRWLRLSLHHIIKSHDICDIDPLYTNVTVSNIFTCAKSYSDCFKMWHVYLPKCASIF